MNFERQLLSRGQRPPIFRKHFKLKINTDTTNIFSGLPSPFAHFPRPLPPAFCPGGERRADFFRRVSSVCDEILSRHDTGTVIVVGHGGTLRSCLSHLLPEELGEWWTYAMDNCGVTEVLVWGEKAELLTLNDTSHLPEE